MNDKVIGRKKEKQILIRISESKEAELLAIYGRRRVGKTFLIETFLAPLCDIRFTVTGIKDAPLARQLHHFQTQLEQTFYHGVPLPTLNTWDEALSTLCKAVKATAQENRIKNILIFMDELPWMDVPKSGLIQALDHYWNTVLSRISSVRLVLCGSATSWILENLINAKGGLHNRVTQILKLKPFNLAESKEYLLSRGVNLEDKQIIELTMAVGGIPLYLRHVLSGHSVMQNIASLCFEENGFLREEFKRLFQSLFSKPDPYIRIIRALAENHYGLEIKTIAEEAKLSLGGRLLGRLEELEACGFISSLVPYGNIKKNMVYRLTDEYTLFYLKWIETSPKNLTARGSVDYWQSKANSQAVRIWQGYAFETLCLKHIDQIRSALGLNSISCEISTWKHIPKKGQPEKGAQIDLVLDRSDDSISICEIKYTNDVYSLEKSYAKELHHKMDLFKEHTGTRKTLFLELLTTYGLKPNLWSEGLIAHVVQVEDLFLRLE